MASENRSSEKLSRLISRSLILNGLGKYKTDLAKHHSLVIEHLTDKNEMFHGGSTAEGTKTPDSDLDQMFVVPDILVKTSEANKSESDRKCDIFLLDTSESNPGYARLRLLLKSQKESSVVDGLNVNLQDLLEETKEGIYLRSENTVIPFVKVLIEGGYSAEYFKHGPCFSANVDLNGHVEGIVGSCTGLDIAFAIVCCEWPDEAKGWITRKRPHNWPPQSLVEKIRGKKCHVVPIGNPQSKYCALEWRVSYLLSERELVWSFNDTQIHCYFLLKRLLKLFLEIVAPDQLSSYHMKTLLFWVSEERGLSIWYAENLISCLEVCLDKLYDCVKHKKLQHYFNCHTNLFLNKFRKGFQKKRMLEKIAKIRTNIAPFLLTHLSEDWEWPLLWFLSKDFAKLFRCTDYYALETNFNTQKQKIEDFELYKSISSILLNVTSEWKDTKNQFNMVSIGNQLEDVNVYFFIITQLFLGFRFAMAYFRQITIHDDEAVQRYVDSESITLADIIELVSFTCMCDKMSGELYLATAYHFLKDYKKSTKIVNVLFKKRMYLVYPGACSTYTTIHLTGGGFCKQEDGINFADTEGKTYPAYDIIFSHKDVYCVPYPVQFECAVSEFEKGVKSVFIHPCVYAYFLLCYGQYISKDFDSFRNTLVYLEKAVNETKGGKVRRHALNILSYCYVLDENLKKAFKYFTESLIITENKGHVWNAAAIHIAIILMNKFEKKRLIKSAFIHNS